MFVVSELPNGWFRLSYADGTDFLVDEIGSQIWIVWSDGFTLDDACSYLLGPVMGFVLRLRGLVCLHASAVVIEGRALAIIGPPGAGKSTTAAAFAACGHAALSDDVVPLSEANGGFEAHPGYPRVRLWPSSVRALAEIDRSIPELPSAWGARRYHLNLQQQGYAFQTEPRPLGAIYVLADRSSDNAAPSIEPLSGRRSVLALIGNSFASTLFDRAMRARDLDVLSRVAATVPVRQVTPQHEIGRLRQLCDAILNDFLALPMPVAAAVCVD
jgi:hypothetical protein